MPIALNTVDDALKQKGSNRQVLDMLVQYMGTPEGALDVLLAGPGRIGGGVDLDFFWTFIRLHGVFTLTYQNNANKDAGDASYGSPTNIILTVAGIGVFAAGSVRALYQVLRKTWLKSDAFYLGRLQALAPTPLDDEEALSHHIEALTNGYYASVIEKKNRLKKKGARKEESFFNKRNKKNIQLANVFEDLEFSTEKLSEKLMGKILEVLPHIVREDASTEEIRQTIRLLVNAFKVKKIRDDLDRIKNEKVKDHSHVFTAEKKPQSSNKFVTVLNEFQDSKIYGAINKIWNWLKTYSYIYWLIWMPVVIFVSVSGAAASLPVVLATLAVGSVFSGWTFGRWIYNQVKAATAKPEVALPAEEKALKEREEKDEARAEHEAKLLKLAADHHNASMEKIHGVETWAHLKEILNGNKELKKFQTKTSPVKANYDVADKLAKVKSHRLTERFVGSVASQRLRLAMTVMSAISGFVMVAFVVWFTSTVLALAIAPLFAAVGLTAASSALMTVASFFGATSTTLAVVGPTTLGSIIAAATGAGVGLLGMLLDVTKLYQQQKDYEHNVHTILSAEYKPRKRDLMEGDKPYQFAGKSVLEVYDTLRESVKANLAAARLAVVKSKKTLTEKSTELEIIRNIAATINNSQDEARYFEKFELQSEKTLWSKIKHVASRFYEFLSQSQTGIFTARNLFLAGGACCGLIGVMAASLGTLIPFLLIVVAITVVVGTLGTVKLELDRAQEHRQTSLEAIFAKIKTLKKWDQLLGAIKSEKPKFIKRAATRSEAPSITSPQKDEPLVVKPVLHSAKNDLPEQEASVFSMFSGERPEADIPRNASVAVAIQAGA